VHKVLFPYARKHLGEFVKAHAGERKVREQLDAIGKLERHELSLPQTVAVLEKWIDEDRKVTPLKALQGMIWKIGYEKGELKGHVYPDTPQYLKQWHDAGKKLYVYSSGSVDAQKLIFSHTEHGDLTPLFSGYFDTRVGGKKESASYRAILQAISRDGRETLFLSDAPEELDAARAAGVGTCQLVRDGKIRPALDHPRAKDFSEVRV